MFVVSSGVSTSVEGDCHPSLPQPPRGEMVVGEEEDSASQALHHSI